MNTDSFIIYIKTKDVYEDIANNVKKRFDLSNFEINRSLPNGNKKNVIGLIKDELRETTMTAFTGLTPKTYSYLIEKIRKLKEQKKNSLKRILKFEGYKKSEVYICEQITHNVYIWNKLQLH